MIVDAVDGGSAPPGVDLERLLPEGWVEHGTSLRSRDDDGSGYGAHWWVWDDPAGSCCAQGYETQRILVVPDRELVACIAVGGQ